VSVSAKEAFQLAFDANGGHEAAGAVDQICSKLFPIDLSANALATGPKHLPLLSQVLSGKLRQVTSCPKKRARSAFRWTLQRI